MMDKLVNRGDRGITDAGQETKASKGSVAPVAELVPVQRLFGNILVMRDGSYRMIMRTTSLNFDLKSDGDQELIIYSFAEMLNMLSIDFPLQVVLHSSAADTGPYVNRYAPYLNDPNMNPKLQAALRDHLDHFVASVRDHHVLDRSYFVVIPYFGGVAGAVASDRGGLLSRVFDTSAGEKERATDRRALEAARTQLNQRAGRLASALARIGIQSRVLDEFEIVRLLREMNNPGSTARQRHSDALLDDDVLRVEVVRRDRSRGRGLPPGAGGEHR